MSETYKTLVEAAKAYGRARHVSGGPGGWLRQQVPGGKSVGTGYHGWEDYGVALVHQNVIRVLDKDGCRVDREKTRHGVRVNSPAMWRQRGTTFVVPELSQDEQSYLQRMAPQGTVRDQAKWAKTSAMLLVPALEALAREAQLAVLGERTAFTPAQVVALTQARAHLATLDRRVAEIVKAMEGTG